MVTELSFKTISVVLCFLTKVNERKCKNESVGSTVWDRVVLGLFWIDSLPDDGVIIQTRR